MTTRYISTDEQRPSFVHYEIVDRHTGKIVATAKTRSGATRAVDRRDNEYGAYRYYARPLHIAKEI